MRDAERQPGREPSPDEPARAGREGQDRGEQAAGHEARLDSAENNVHAEATGEKREAKERIADMLWEKPKHFVERIVADKLAPYFRRFLGKFSELDDDAMATDALKRTRDAAAKAGKEGPEQT